MPNTLWSQDIFTKGELSPFMYSRATVNEYGNGLKTAQNVLTYPSGAAGKRFGTLYQATLDVSITSFDQFYFQTFQYLNECVYQLVITPGTIYIFLEGMPVAIVANTYNRNQVFNLNTTTLGAAFRIAGPVMHPQDLTRSNTAPNVITTAAANVLTVTSTLLNGILLAGSITPIQITTTGSVPTTNPQISPNVTYFIKILTATTANLYPTAKDAKFGTNIITITNNGTGTNSLIEENVWTLANCVFKNLPIYDFNGPITSYDAITFTPGAASGDNVTITLSAPYAPLDSSYVGGAFIGNGGTSRIKSVTDTSHFIVTIEHQFDNTNAIQGSFALLAEPAWSDKRGWPQVCSSYQSRALFANTTSLPNGFYASVTNDYTDFGDLTTDDDDAISWYPTSDNMNFIKFIVPYRSVTVHTNTGIYSSPLSDVSAITPTNFSLQLQDSNPADVVQPQAVDNQILVLSGNDAHQMLWDGLNNAYESNIVSVISEQTIRSPQDETAFQPLHRAGSRFVFIVNANGSMAAFQTLLSQGVSGFVPQIMEQSYGNASFRQVASSAGGRAWFVVERQKATAGSPIAITGFAAASGSTSSTLKAVASNFSTTVPTAVRFTTTGTLPASSPQILTTRYYWVIGTTADDFNVYLTQDDAIADEDAIAFTSAGTTSNVVPCPLATIFTLEELSLDVFLDCAVQYDGTPASTITTGALFNAQDIKMVGDGFGFDAPAETNVGNQIVFKAHGVLQPVSHAFIGFPVNTIIEPMPLTISSGNSAKETTLTRPKHVRFCRFMFNNTIGGTINGVPIALKPFSAADIGEPPFPGRGFVELAIFKDWDDFNNPTYTIEHNEPFDIQLLGVFYSVDI